MSVGGVSTSSNCVADYLKILLLCRVDELSQVTDSATYGRERSESDTLPSHKKRKEKAALSLLNKTPPRRIRVDMLNAKIRLDTPILVEAEAAAIE